MSSDSTPTARLKKGCAKPLHGGHPWVFADAIAALTPQAEAGDEVRVVDDSGKFLGRGFFSPSSAIAIRLLSQADEPISPALLEKRIDEALRLRRDVLRLGVLTAQAPTTAYRLINSEGDWLGGLTADVYGSYVALQIGTSGMARRLDHILDVLEDRLRPAGILDRSDEKKRRLEKLPPPYSGPLRGKAPEEEFQITEAGLPLLCDLRAGHGQKTGLYLDQRENRQRLATFAAGRAMLDVFCYNGGFALHAMRAGAGSITLLDSSAASLELARQNLELNKIDDADLVNAAWAEGFKLLRSQGRLFGLVVVDPPKFAAAKEHLTNALAGYRDLNAQAARLISPGGLLFTCSCSGNVSAQDFERAVAAGLHVAGRRSSVLERRGAASDHPIPPGFDQGKYLKCLLLQVD